ncbi:hypothetical protein ACI48D_18635 [Massilia sp. LXY-6]|uniref:hypothetical protein n=1 Tax=Massilia sp. LXY-6 TaxID=3379823 RepID=UPI003EE31C59
MTFKKLTYASIATCFLAFLSLLSCVLLSPIEENTKDWLVASFFSFIIALISARMLRQKKSYVREEDQTTIGESTFEVAMVAMILWLPVLLALYGIVGIMFFHSNFKKFGWVLVVLAGNTGFQAAKLYCFAPDDQE